ncbi:hypothetical protein AB0O18_30645 [Streptomyces sp. NPDC093224]
MNDVLSIAADLLTIAGTFLSLTLQLRRAHQAKTEEQDGDSSTS